MVPPFFSVSIARQPCNNPRDPHRLHTDKLLCFICGNKIATKLLLQIQPPSATTTANTPQQRPGRDGTTSGASSSSSSSSSFILSHWLLATAATSFIVDIHLGSVFQLPLTTHNHPLPPTHRDSKWPCIPCVINVNNQAKFPVRVFRCVCLEQHWWS